MNTDQVKPSEDTPLDDIMISLAASLRDVMQATPEDVLIENPEDVYTDLALRLVLRLARERLTIVPSIQNEHDMAARRIFDVFTRWMQKQPWIYCDTCFNPLSGKFEITLTDAVNDEIRGFFQGESIQDAYAQAAQTIALSGGTL